jgi:hypothetical protein
LADFDKALVVNQAPEEFRNWLLGQNDHDSLLRDRVVNPRTIKILHDTSERSQLPMALPPPGDLATGRIVL